MDNVNDILSSGREVEVQDKNGKLLVVKVNKVSHLKGATLVSAYENDLRFVMLVTGKTEKELEEISEDGFYDLLEVGHELNSKTLTRALESRAKKLGNPIYQKFLKEASSLTSSLGD